MKSLYEKKKEIIKPFIIVCVIILFTSFMMVLLNKYNLIFKDHYKASDFKIKTLYSSSDFDKDKIDDYADFLLGARKLTDSGSSADKINKNIEILKKAFANAGYDIEKMIKNDIKLSTKDYKSNKVNIRNIDVYLSKYAVVESNNINKIERWQPGDIVIFAGQNIGIVSDKRNKMGVTYLIYYNGTKFVENDYLNKIKINKHYRFDATLIKQDKLVKV